MRKRDPGKLYVSMFEAFLNVWVYLYLLINLFDFASDLVVSEPVHGCPGRQKATFGPGPGPPGEAKSSRKKQK